MTFVHKEEGQPSMGFCMQNKIPGAFSAKDVWGSCWQRRRVNPPPPWALCQPPPPSFRPPPRVQTPHPPPPPLLRSNACLASGLGGCPVPHPPTPTVRPPRRPPPPRLSNITANIAERLCLRPPFCVTSPWEGLRSHAYLRTASDALAHYFVVLRRPHEHRRCG